MKAHHADLAQGGISMLGGFIHLTECHPFFSRPHFIRAEFLEVPAMNDSVVTMRAQQISERLSGTGCTVAPTHSGGILIRGPGVSAHLQFPDPTRLPVWAQPPAPLLRVKSARPRAPTLRPADVAAWRSAIAAWLTARGVEPFSVADVLEALHLSEITHAHRHRVCTLLREIGARQRSVQTTDAGAVRRWVNERTP